MWFPQVYSAASHRADAGKLRRFSSSLSFLSFNRGNATKPSSSYLQPRDYILPSSFSVRNVSFSLGEPSLSNISSSLHRPPSSYPSRSPAIHLNSRENSGAFSFPSNSSNSVTASTNSPNSSPNITISSSPNSNYTTSSSNSSPSSSAFTISSSVSSSGIKTAKRLTPLHRVCELFGPLAVFMDRPSATRIEVIQRLWEYIRKKDLQKPSDRRRIVADDLLRPLLGKDEVHMLEIPGIINKYIISPKKEKESSTK